MDNIASYFLKVAFPVISDSLCDILNLSLSSGIFPDSWKVARVAPIFKEGPTDERSNYRPISCYGLPMDAIILVFLCNRCQDTLGLLCMLCSVQQGLFLDFIHYCGYAEDIIKWRREKANNQDLQGIWLQNLT